MSLGGHLIKMYSNSFTEIAAKWFAKSIRIQFSFSMTLLSQKPPTGTIFSQTMTWKTSLLTLISIWLGGAECQLLANTVICTAQTCAAQTFRISNTRFGSESGPSLLMCAQCGSAGSTTATQSTSSNANRLTALTAICQLPTTLTSIDQHQVLLVHSVKVNARQSATANATATPPTSVMLTSKFLETAYHTC